MLNVGVGGSGPRQSQSPRRIHLEMPSFQIEISKSYTMVEWREDLKNFARKYATLGNPLWLGLRRRDRRNSRKKRGKEKTRHGTTS